VTFTSTICWATIVLCTAAKNDFASPKSQAEVPALKLATFEARHLLDVPLVVDRHTNRYRHLICVYFRVSIWSTGPTRGS
jgi:hypothetical protein